MASLTFAGCSTLLTNTANERKTLSLVVTVPAKVITRFKDPVFALTTPRPAEPSSSNLFFSVPNPYPVGSPVNTDQRSGVISISGLTINLNVSPRFSFVTSGFLILL